MWIMYIPSDRSTFSISFDVLHSLYAEAKHTARKENIARKRHLGKQIQLGKKMLCFIAMVTNTCVVNKSNVYARNAYRPLQRVIMAHLLLSTLFDLFLVRKLTFE